MTTLTDDIALSPQRGDMLYMVGGRVTFTVLRAPFDMDDRRNFAGTVVTLRREECHRDGSPATATDVVVSVEVWPDLVRAAGRASRGEAWVSESR